MIISRLLVCWKQVKFVEDENLYGFYKRNQVYSNKPESEMA